MLLPARRLTAVKVFCMFAGAFVLAEAGKKLIGEHRPPVPLQAMVAGSGASYPSGHATTAAVLVVALTVITTAAAWRYAAIAAAGSRSTWPATACWTCSAGCCGLAAVFVVTGLAAPPAVLPWLQRLDARRRRHRAPIKRAAGQADPTQRPVFVTCCRARGGSASQRPHRTPRLPPRSRRRRRRPPRR
jgi:hypothetical protein